MINRIEGVSDVPSALGVQATPMAHRYSDQEPASFAEPTSTLQQAMLGAEENLPDEDDLEDIFGETIAENQADAANA